MMFFWGFLCLRSLGKMSFTSLTDKQLRHYEKLFRDPELFLPSPHWHYADEMHP